MAGNKRRRADEDGGLGDEKTAQTSKCKGATTIPIFLKKTYKMIDTCDPNIASWTADGDMFVVKDPDVFATSVIPAYFDHNKFSSFARQLNFYGFRKMQSKPIRNSDFDANTAKHVTFFNENFKRGRCDLLKNIQRSTRGGGNTPGQDQQREVQSLKDKITTLETTITEMGAQMEERMRRLELDMLGRMEQMMLAMQQQQQNAFLQKQATAPTSNDSIASKATMNTHMTAATKNAFHAANAQNLLRPFGGMDPLAGYGGRATSIGSFSGLQNHFAGLGDSSALGMAKSLASHHGAGGAGAASQGGATLPPHPKQKQLPGGPASIPSTLNIPPGRLASLGTLSNLSRNISNLSRGTSIESQSSAFLNNHAFEDKIFSMLVAGEKQAALNAQLNLDPMNPTPMSDTILRQAMANANAQNNANAMHHANNAAAMQAANNMANLAAANAAAAANANHNNSNSNSNSNNTNSSNASIASGPAAGVNTARI
ncbi:unnamed protein product [Cylindrotheca closterium]|uniref:HSF-type DNA-binding domain-containing protein n=1 Tax=Cylindrotheca closterium TaxID=2856 RepID=A0AAD2JGA8_9STRA|nr:unnamed protein product [Cylindrotheca closterium]